MNYVYGGCGKTENLFFSEIECFKTCSKGFNGDTPEVVVDNFPPPTPVDCHVSSWGEWSACSVTCGGVAFRYFCLLKVQ